MASTPGWHQAEAAIEALRRRFEGRAAVADAVGQELGEVLALLRGVDLRQAGALQPSAHTIAARGGAALPSRHGRVAEVLDALQPLWAALPWRYGYTARPDLAGLEDRMAWAELVGPAAPVRSETVCLGFTAIDAHTRYPEHLHPAIELYFVLSGTARWTAAGVTTEQRPGNWILHPANVVHVMATGDEPLVAAYTWRRDIHGPSVYLR